MTKQQKEHVKKFGQERKQASLDEQGDKASAKNWDPPPKINFSFEAPAKKMAYYNVSNLWLCTHYVEKYT